MAIKGSLKEASLPDVIQLLFLGRRTGCLALADRHNFGTIYFDEGLIVYAAIVNRRDRIGDILVRSGRISAEKLAEAVARQDSDRDLVHRRVRVIRGEQQGERLVAERLRLDGRYIALSEPVRPPECDVELGRPKPSDRGTHGAAVPSAELDRRGELTSGLEHAQAGLPALAHEVDHHRAGRRAELGDGLVMQADQLARPLE